MATVISNEKVGRHTVDKYSFKVLSVGGHETEDKTSETDRQTVESQEPSRSQSDVDSSAMSQSSKDALIESLMK